MVYGRTSEEIRINIFGEKESTINRCQHFLGFHFEQSFGIIYWSETTNHTEEHFLQYPEYTLTQSTA